jgi:hypothetical protein
MAAKDTAPELVARHWIDGEWLDAKSASSRSYNPATGETIGT